LRTKQPIAELQDLRELEVVINVPERLVRRMQSHQEAIAFFDDDAEQSLALELKSFAADADPLTQTYVAVLSVKSIPKGLNLLPGMAVNVQPAMRREAMSSTEAAVAVPLSAVAPDAQGAPGVWVVDEGGRVERRPIETGDIRGARIVVRSGLERGQRIVAAGVGGLREGMRVRALAMTTADRRQ